jgi:hypothetical protein
VATRVARRSVDDGGMPDKILALNAYDMSVISSVHSGSNKKIIENNAAKIVASYFESLVDAKARANHSSLHHMYEFDQTGQKNARLFKKNISNSGAGAVISFTFLDSKMPNRNGQIFYKKAIVMEKQSKPVVISPKSAGFLVFQLDDGSFVKTKKTIVVRNPGGDTKNMFENEFNSFISTSGNRVLNDINYFGKINSSIRLKRSSIIKSINSGLTSDAAQRAVQDSVMIALSTGGDVVD